MMTVPVQNRWIPLLFVPLLAACGAEASDAGLAGTPTPAADAVEVEPSEPGGPEPAGPAGADPLETPAAEAANAGATPEAEAPGLPTPVRLPSEPPRFERPEHVRGIYLNAWTAGSGARVEDLIRLARETEINTFVIDVKDASGMVSYATGVELARESGAVGDLRIRDLPGLLRRLEEEGIYPVARIVIVQDPVLIAHKPELAIQDTAGGVWVDGRGTRWLNPHSREVWDYHVDLAREAAELGFPEIQWDYVRFPDAPRSELASAVYPGAEGRGHAATIRAFFLYARERLADTGAAMSADVFGVTTSARDVGIGQIWEEFIDLLDAAQPMIYPSHYARGSFGIDHPNAQPYETVRSALEAGIRRSAGVEGAGRIIPWLQDFSLGEPPYGVEQVRAQIRAAADAGIHEWVFWNPSSRYTEGAFEPETP